MTKQLRLGDIVVDVQLKDIKNVHLSVHPPLGRVSIAAPTRMTLDTIRVYAVSRLSWIKQQQRKLRSQARETARDFVERESHFVWGKRYLLKVIEHDHPPSVDLTHNRLILRVRPGTDQRRKQAVIEGWYREQLKAVVLQIIAKWDRKLSVTVARYHVQKMRTKWGSCNQSARSIRLNTDLAKKTRDCLEYVVVHEMAHLVERHHNERFVRLMNRHLPNWKLTRQALNEGPLPHVTWPD